MGSCRRRPQGWLGSLFSRRALELYREAHLSTEPARPQASPRLPQADADQGRHARSDASPRQGPQAPVGLSGWASPAGGPPWSAAPVGQGTCAVALTTLKKRSEFLWVRGGRRWSAAAFVLEARVRQKAGEAARPARFGYTVSKKVGGAVVRNRVRRRLRALTAGLRSGARAAGLRLRADRPCGRRRPHLRRPQGRPRSGASAHSSSPGAKAPGASEVVTSGFAKRWSRSIGSGAGMSAVLATSHDGGRLHGATRTALRQQ